MTHRPGNRPDEQQEQRQPDELNPARNLDLLRPDGHDGHATAEVVQLRPRAWDWSFAEDGALALDPAEMWNERKVDVDALLKAWETFVTVPRMPRPSGQRPSARKQRVATASVRRTRRLIGFVLLVTVVFVTLLLTAFGADRAPAVRTAGPAPAARLLPTGPPGPQVVALAGSLRLQLPIEQSRVTAIGYHASGEGAIALEPVGHQANEGAFSRMARRLFGGGANGLRWYQLSGGEGPSSAALNVGASPGTDVYSPVEGTVVALTPYVVSGKTYGARIDVQPSGAPSLVVSITHLKPDPALTVGSSVAAGTSKIGSVIDFSSVERQALARYTQDAGNHVEVQVRPSAALALP